jgi:hypothetical protein
MRVIVPVTPTLISSTVPEPDTGEATYSAGATYALGATVISTTTHRVYESLQAANTGNPLPVPPETQTDWWIETGVTNRWASLDSARNTQSVGASPMVVVIAPGARINSVAVMGMEADTLRIEMINGGAVVYDKSFDLKLRRVRDGYEYCFKPFGLQPSVLQFDLPPFFAAQVRVTLTRATGSVKLGSVVVGNYIYLGAMQQGAENDALNFSTIDRDLYGTATLVPRRTLPVTTQTCIIEKQRVTDLLDARVRLNAVPAVWSGLDDLGSSDWFEAFLILGIYKRFSINSQYSASHALVNLNLEEI